MASSNKSKIKVKYHKSEVAAGYLFLLPNFIGFTLFMIIPIFMGFYISLTDYDGFKQMNFVGFQNYIDMFSDGYFTVSLKNNILFTLITVPLTLVVSLLLAVGVNSVRGKPVTLEYAKKLKASGTSIPVGVVGGYGEPELMERALENGIPIQVLFSNLESVGVDTPEDLARAEARLAALKEG